MTADREGYLVTKKKEAFELSIVPGWIHAEEARDHTSSGTEADWRVDLPCPQLAPEERAEIIEHFTDDPLELNALLKNHLPAWLDERISSKHSPEAAKAECRCGDAGCKHVPAVIQAAEQKLQEEPLLWLTLIGLSREELLDAVFRGWAETMPEAAESSDDEALGRLEEKGKSGPSAGEWLAEAAEQGKLHEPGAGYRDVAFHLNAKPEGEPQIDNWTPLLPNVKAVQQLVAQLTSETAAKAWEDLSGKQDSQSRRNERR